MAMITMFYLPYISAVLGDCGSLSSPENGLIDLPGGTTFGQIATFSCHLGYILQGQQELVCTGNSVWDNVAPTCQINDLYCGGVLDPQHGSVSTSDLSRLNSTATYRCNTGYRMVGPETRTCSENMAWEPDQDTECIIQDCGILRNPLNGNVDQSSGTTYGQTVTFSCSVGYQIFGAEQATCMADGSWSTTSPLCQITSMLLSIFDRRSFMWKGGVMK
ncbi:E-selectin-like [Mercenaria mercenaria]|uniref:E-selectin-like n=1 Tax=Mercenaria mercenaria TaxID=6596 RepID=UPI00234F29F7|nr:E-selectin-like [Mercenaria mercenaria]